MTPQREHQQRAAAVGDAPEPADTAGACLQASLLLRRRIHRYRQAGMGDEQALLAVCGVLDALARDSVAHPGAPPGAVAHAVGRLVERLHRADPPAATTSRLPLATAQGSMTPGKER